MDIENSRGEVIFRCNGDFRNAFSRLERVPDLCDAQMNDLILEGVQLDDANLAGSNLRGADLY